MTVITTTNRNQNYKVEIVVIILPLKEVTRYLKHVTLADLLSSPDLFLCLCVLSVFVASSILRECGRHPERQQPDHCVYRWQDVLLESGHAFPAAGTQHTHHQKYSNDLSFSVHACW